MAKTTISQLEHSFDIFFLSTLGRKVEMVNEKRDKGKELERKREKGTSGVCWRLRRFPAVRVSQLLCRPSLCQRENHGNDFASPLSWNWIHMPYNDPLFHICPNISLCWKEWSCWIFNLVSVVANHTP